MNILFISLLEINSLQEHGLYTDLLREFVNHGHTITIVSPVERRKDGKTQLIIHDRYRILKVKIGNIQKTNYIEKGISAVLLGYQLTKAIRRYCSGIKFDLLLYATPPVTIYNAVKKVKSSTGAQTFLMLKDIWPQEIVDLGIISSKGLVYKFFKKAEKRMYGISDWIGCTSPANIAYLTQNNKEIEKERVVRVNNSVDHKYRRLDWVDKEIILRKYSINTEDIVFFYGGNLGKPQDIEFVIKCLETQMNISNRFFILCGQGTEYEKLKTFFDFHKPGNMLLLPYLPKDNYDQMIEASDVGMVFLNHRFTVPNCPSRFYTYMEYAKPVLACTDCATDIKNDIMAGDFGWWCESNSVELFSGLIDTICSEGRERLIEIGKRSRKYLEANYTVDKDYYTIINCINKSKTS